VAGLVTLDSGNTCFLKANRQSGFGNEIQVFSRTGEQDLREDSGIARESVDVHTSRTCLGIGANNPMELPNCYGYLEIVTCPVSGQHSLASIFMSRHL